MTRALIVGASGQIGQAAARALHADGYDLLLADRGNQPLLADVAALDPQRVVVDRADPETLARAVGDGVDVLVDVIAFTAEHGEQLIALGDRVGHLVVISSASVYADPDGNALDGRDDHPSPRFAGPITEDTPTVAPGPGDYATRKVALEQVLLGQDTVPVAVFRPAAVHGPAEKHAREWWVVKRALDGRRHCLLAHADTCFHTTATANLGELIRLAAARQAHGAWNAVDAEALTTGEIIRAVAAAADWAPEFLFLDPPPPDEVGISPWSVEHSLVLSMDRAIADFGYAPVTDYRSAVPATVAWLRETVGAREDWLSVLTSMAGYGETLLNYPAEDAFLAARE